MSSVGSVADRREMPSELSVNRTAGDPKWRVGKVGLGTKADSVTRFRMLTITSRGA